MTGCRTRDYVEQLTFVLFLKMADEQSRAPFNKPSPIPRNVDWHSLMWLDGDELETHFRHVLDSLGEEKICSESSSARRRTRSRTLPSYGG
jgi:hypothetical protein